MANIRVGTIAGRHEMPVDEFIFEGVVNPRDVDGINHTVYEYFDKVLNMEYGYYSNDEYREWYSSDTVDLYVTGLTVVTTAVVRHCLINNIKLTLWHYDSVAGEYYPQCMY